MAEKVKGLREIIYDPQDVPSPVFAGTLLWVVLFFFPLPLMLIIHWWLNQQPETTVWLRASSIAISSARPNALIRPTNP